MTTILSYGDNPLASTGYGCVWENLLSRWAKAKPDWKFYHVGWQQIDREFKTAEGYYRLPTGRAEMGADTIVPNTLQLKPDFLVTLADVGKQLGYVKAVFEAKKMGWKGKWVAYVPLDTPNWALYWDEMFDAPDIIISMSEFGKAQMEKFGVKKVTPILHGVDTEVYRPLEERNILRQKFEIDNKFVVGFVGRNQIRKMQPYWMKGFAKFAKGKDDVCLLLHTDADPPAGEGRGWAMNAIIWKLEKEIGEDLTKSKKIILTRSNLDIKERQKIGKNQMNEIYNLMDLFLFPTGGEGFGLPIVECQSAGVPIIMSDNTTGPELAGKTGELIKMLKDNHNRTMSVIGTNGVTNAIPDDEHIAELLEKYYADWKNGKKLLKEMSKKGREFALTLSWDNISKKWIDLFEEEK